MNLSYYSNETVSFVYRTKTELACLLLSIIIAVPVIVIGSAGNVAVCWIVATVKKLRTPANIQLVSIAIVDLLTCALVTPLAFYANIHFLLYDTNIFTSDGSLTMCRTYVFTWFLSLTVSCVSLGLLSVTRAMGVSGKFSAGAMKLIIVGSISVSFVAGSVYAVARAVMAPQRFCLIDEMPADIVHIVNKIGFALIFDTLLMVSVSYGYVFCLKYKQRKTAKFLVQNSSNINKRDVATIRICFVLVVAYIVAYLPIGIFAFLHGINAIPRNLYYSRLVYSISYSGSMVNPIIYCLMSSKFRQHVLGCVPEKKAVVKASSLGSGTSSTPNRPTVDQKVHETSIVQTISSAIDNGNLVRNNGTAEMTEVFGVDNLAIEID